MGWARLGSPVDGGGRVRNPRRPSSRGSRVRPQLNPTRITRLPSCSRASTPSTLGDPARRPASGEWRYRRKGSLAVNAGGPRRGVGPGRRGCRPAHPSGPGARKGYQSYTGPTQKIALRAAQGMFSLRSRPPVGDLRRKWLKGHGRGRRQSPRPQTIRRAAGSARGQTPLSAGTNPKLSHIMANACAPV